MLKMNRKTNCHEVHLFVVNGMKVHTKLSTINEMLFSKVFFGILFSFVITLSSFTEGLFLTPAPFPARFVYWGINAALATLCWWATVIVLSITLWRRHPKIVVPNVLICVFWVWVIYGLDILFMTALGFVRGATYVTILWDLPRNMLVVILFEFVIAQYIWPHFALPSAESVLPDTDRILWIKGKRIDVSELQFARAEEHYVEFRMTTRTELIRMAMRDVIALFNHHEGIQTHRSWWVARSCVAGIERAEGKPVLRLLNGMNVPIARNRLSEVRSWLDGGADKRG